MRRPPTQPPPAEELLTPEEMSRADRMAAEQGVPTRRLMEAAGWAVARAALAHGPCRTLVLCGPGNNGGDGYVAARLLAGRGWPVLVAAVGRPTPGSDAADAAAAWRGPCSEPMAAAASRAELVIDALYGAGLSRSLDGPEVDALRAAAASWPWTSRVGWTAPPAR